MAYFAVLWRHKQISLTELQLVKPSNLTTHGQIVIFDTETPDLISQLGGIIKRGTTTILWDLLAQYNILATDVDNSDDETTDESNKSLSWLPSIVGTNSRILGKYLKQSGFTRRFKELTLDHSDREVQDKGVELILIHSNESIDESVIIGRVTHYQDIDLFSAVDYDKPSAGMGIGMMPAKLTLMMINIARAQYETNHVVKSEYTIYDPFCGFGTTNFLANAMWYDTIWSDLNGSLIKPNLVWRNTHARHTQHRFTSFKHDATQPITKPFVKHTDMIVTEWRLWPVVTQRLMPKVAHHQLTQIGQVYCNFLTQVDTYFDDITICMTVPVYQFYDDVIWPMIEDVLYDDKSRTITPIPQVYSRKWQYVTRQILVLQKYSR